MRTEHMFFGSGERIRTVRRMIMVGSHYIFWLFSHYESNEQTQYTTEYW